MKPQDGRAEPSPSPEWLETDGLGGFASGTRDGHRTRRYHALLCAADSPPVGRRVLVPGLEVWVETADGAEALSTQVYEPDVVQPRGFRSITAFDRTPWPTWRFAFSNGTAITFEVATVREQPGVVLRWRHTDGPTPRALHVRPFVTDRDFHHLDRANDSWNGSTETRPGGHTRVTWRPYPSDIGRAVDAYTDGSFRPSPQWYFNFRYRTEIARGLDSVEDLGSPGVFTWETWSETGASLVFAARRDGDVPPFGETLTADLSSVAFGNAASELLEAERRRRAAAVAATPANDPPTRLLAEAAESYVVRSERAAGRSGHGKTVVAGYPWFSDWGRDTFIALRGLCLATGRLEEAADILLAWSASVSEGTLPNRFTDDADAEFNAVDASLWYCVVVGEFLSAGGVEDVVSSAERTKLLDAVEAILEGYAAGTRYRIGLDKDGLVAAGVPDKQLTWMDAKVGDWVVTPRVGKPVEIQALWLNSLKVSRNFETRWAETFRRGSASFLTEYWDEGLGRGETEAGGGLVDVVDAEHIAGQTDRSIRPNQLFAAGGLPVMLVPEEKARRVVDLCERLLWTPHGMRTLAPADPGYRGRYAGGVLERDAAYHQGTAWPWLLGPFVDAWVKSRGGTAGAKSEARRCFLEPALGLAETAGLGHIAEVAGGDQPHAPGGCPFQAWSVSELLRLMLVTAS